MDQVVAGAAQEENPLRDVPVRAGDTPVRAGVAYDGRPGTIGAARDFAAGFLRQAEAEHRMPVTELLTDDVRLVVSELVTNAAKYAPGPCLLDLEILDDALRITLWDTEAALPIPSGADASRVGSHGMEIVLALCRRFEVERQAGGKRVQVDLAF
ncbi:ATP-binding protein [Streptacidiphilus sp. PAMC 29251]